MEQYDLIIIGAGPAGLSAGIYGSRYGLKTLLIGTVPGGTAATAPKIHNYLGFEEISGYELTQKMLKQAQNEGAKILFNEVKSIKKEKGLFVINAAKNYAAKKLIFATGTKRTKLNMKGENQLLGKGVSYCATCDGPLFKNKTVAVIGGGNSALTSALMLSEFCKKVYLINRRDSFSKADNAWIELVKANKKIESLLSEELIEVKGKDFVESILLKSKKELKVEGVFIEAGSTPQNELASQLGIKLNERGYIEVDNSQRTSLGGAFAAGDCTNNILKQIITAAGDGATAAFSVHEEFVKKKQDL